MTIAFAVVGLAIGAIELDGAAGTGLLLLPIVMLLVVIVRAMRNTEPPMRSPDDINPDPKTPPSPDPATPKSGVASAILRAIPEGSLEGPAIVAPPSGVEKPLPVASLPTGINLQKNIDAAVAAGDEAALAGLYLVLGREEMAAGRTGPAADHLRASIKSAAISKSAAVQAEGRLELAELARQAGDLTTACEHWQIARGLFYELKQKPALLDTEGLMQKHGCPTDWVLNDF